MKTLLILFSSMLLWASDSSDRERNDAIEEEHSVELRANLNVYICDEFHCSANGISLGNRTLEFAKVLCMTDAIGTPADPFPGEREEGESSSSEKPDEPVSSSCYAKGYWLGIDEESGLRFIAIVKVERVTYRNPDSKYYNVTVEILKNSEVVGKMQIQVEDLSQLPNAILMAGPFSHNGKTIQPKLIVGAPFDFEQAPAPKPDIDLNWSVKKGQLK